MSADSEASACTYLRKLLNGSERATVVAKRPGQYAYLQTEHSRRIIGLEVARTGARLPLSVTVTPWFLAAALAETGWIRLCEHEIATSKCSTRIAHWRDQRLTLEPGPAMPPHAALDLDQLWHLTGADCGMAAVARRTRHFGHVLRAGHTPDIAESTRALIGLGPGSTPAGDDVVAGAAVTLWAIQQRGSGTPAARKRLAALRSAVDDSLGQTTPLSAELLRCSCDGHAVREFHAFIRHLRRGHSVAALTALHSIGHTSGPALAIGAVTAFQALRGTHLEEMSFA